MGSIYERAKRHLDKVTKEGEISKNNSNIIKEFTDYLQATGHARGSYSDKRLEKYTYTLISCARKIDKDFDQLTKKDVNALVSKIRTTYKGDTPRDYLVMFKGLMRYIHDPDGDKYSIRDGEFPDIVKHIRPGQRYKTNVNKADLFIKDEIEALINACSNLRDKAFIHVLWESACRISELIGDHTYDGLLIKDVSFTKYGAEIDVKGGKGKRTLFLHSSAPAMAEWLKLHPDNNNPNAFFFCGIGNTNRGEKVDYRYWSKLLKKLGDKAEITKPLNPHNFRHSRLTYLANFLTEAQLNLYAGWSKDSRQASTYVHLSLRDLKSKLLAMHGIKEEDMETSEFDVITCPRCGVKNDFTAKYCSGCHLGLTPESIKDYMEEEQTQTQRMEKQSRKMEILTKIQKINNQVARGKLTWEDVDEEMDQLEDELEELNDG